LWTQPFPGGVWKSSAAVHTSVQRCSQRSVTWGAAAAFTDRALESLGALEATGARTLLTGHGEPWQEGVAGACRRAREAGVT
jgi:hypothetical protein